MDSKLTSDIKLWLETPHEERDYDLGALLLLKLSGNKIMFNNITVNTKVNAHFIEYNIQKYFNFRVQDITHKEVIQLEKQVAEIKSNRFSFIDNQKNQEARSGKRSDHEELPSNIQLLFDENMQMSRRMRELHLKLRSLSNKNVVCQDSERYPFLKELIQLDKTSHENWNIYDHFIIGKENQEKPPVDDEDVSKKAIRMIHLTKGKYKKNPSVELKQKIVELLTLVTEPSDKLILELKELNIIE